MTCVGYSNNEGCHVNVHAFLRTNVIVDMQRRCVAFGGRASFRNHADENEMQAVCGLYVERVLVFEVVKLARVPQYIVAFGGIISDGRGALKRFCWGHDALHVRHDKRLCFACTTACASSTIRALSQHLNQRTTQRTVPRTTLFLQMRDAST